MITHIIYSYCIPSQNKTKSKLQFKESAKASFFLILKKKTLHATHLLKLLDKICKYEMDQVSIVEDTERTPLCPKINRRTRWNHYTLWTSLKSGVYLLQATDLDARASRVNALHSLCLIVMEYHLLNMYLKATICHIIMTKTVCSTGSTYTDD